MTLRTGTSKTGAVHRYYTCSTCARKGKTVCKGRSIAMAKLGTLVTTQMNERLFQPERHSASPQRALLSARYPVNGAWPAEMRIDMLAAYLDFRNVRELVLAVSRGEAPPPTRYRGVGRAREAIWVKVIVDEHVAPGIRDRQN